MPRMREDHHLAGICSHACAAGLWPPAVGRTPTWKQRGRLPALFFPGWVAPAGRRREEKNVIQVKIAAAIEVNQTTIARFEDGAAWPKRPEEVLMGYAAELDMDVRLLWLHAFVLWLENEPFLDEGEPGGYPRGARAPADVGAGWTSIAVGRCFPRDPPRSPATSPAQ